MSYLKFLKNKNTKKMGVAAMAGLMALAPVASSATTVFAADSTVNNNNTATKNDLVNADIIDESKTGSLTIRKYDITAAEAPLFQIAVNAGLEGAVIVNKVKESVNYVRKNI